MLQTFGGAKIRRVVDRSATRVAEHAHDWPVLSIFVMGGYHNTTELGEALITGPSAILYRAGAAHRNLVGAVGFEQIEIEFDAKWLGSALIPQQPVTRWLGGTAGAAALHLARLCSGGIGELALRNVLRNFVATSQSQIEPVAPRWVSLAQRRLEGDTSISVNTLAKEAERHPSWFGTAYRKATGEGPTETAARFRVERAARALRETDQSYAVIANDAGFCDQSHMNRTFRRLLGRSPSAVRDDRAALRAFDGPSRGDLQSCRAALQ